MTNRAESLADDPPGISPALSVEDRLVLLLSLGRFPAEARALLGRQPSWPLILAQATQHGVLPLLTRNLETLGFPDVPAEVAMELMDARRLNAARNALLVGGLTEILRLLAGAGTPAIPLKGPALADLFYGDATLRVCSDLDVLVPRGAVAQAFRLLLAHGYEHAEGDRVQAAEVDLLLDSNMEYGFMGRTAGFEYLLELHWDVVWRWPGDGLAMEDLWAEARCQTFRGVEAYALSPEWQLLYLSVHAARHRWQALKWLVDIHEACALPDLDWARVRDKASRFGWERLLAITLNACRVLLGTPIPPEFSLKALPGWLTLFPATPAAPVIWRDALFPARLFPGLSGKVAYLARLLLIPTLAEHRLLRIPSPVSPLYSPLRLARLGRKWGWPLAQAGLSRLRGGRMG